MVYPIDSLLDFVAVNLGIFAVDNLWANCYELFRETYRVFTCETLYVSKRFLSALCPV